MKKNLICGIIILMLIMPVVGAINESKIETPQIVANDDFTHTVIVESGSQTTCPYCVTASSQLYSIYNAGDLDFYYVTLIWDRGPSRIRDRLKELDILSIPDVYFDGKLTHIGGAQEDEQPYRDKITQAGTREVADIDVSVSVQFKAGGTLKIEIVVTNNAPEDYNGRLITYILEKESRWNDNSGNPYHYAVLDIPIDSELTVYRSQTKSTLETHTFTKTWFGGLYGFNDITQDNIEVVAAVFDAETGYAVETASASPTLDPTSYRTTTPTFLEIISQRLITRFPMIARLLLG